MNEIPALVIDASAFLSLFLPDESGRKMEALIKDIVRKNGQLLVPPLFWYEVLNGLATSLKRGRITDEELDSIESDMSVLPIACDYLPTPFIRKRIRDYAVRYRLSIYDAAYLELATRSRLPLKTLDKHLLGLREEFACIE